MRVGIAADHGGFGLKEELRTRLTAAGHEVIDSVQTGSRQATTIRISLLRLRGQSRPAALSAGLPFAEAEWVLPFAPTKFRGSAPA